MGRFQVIEFNLLDDLKGIMDRNYAGKVAFRYISLCTSLYICAFTCVCASLCGGDLDPALQVSFGDGARRVGPLLEMGVEMGDIL